MAKVVSSMRMSAVGLVVLALLVPVLVPASASPAASDLQVSVPLHLSSGRYGASSVVVGMKAYVFGGYEAPGKPLRDILEFDRDAGTITLLDAKLPTGRFYTSAAWSGSKAYIFGGQDDKTWLSDVVTFDPTTGAVETLALKVPSGRSKASAEWADGKAYLFGGQDAAGRWLSDIVAIDTAGGKATLLPAKLHAGIGYPMTAVLGSEIYVFGGYLGGGSASSSITRFNPSAGTASSGGSLPDTLRAGVAFAYQDQIILVGGTTVSVGHAIDTIQLYDPQTKATSTLPAKLPKGIEGQALAWFPGVVEGYTFGGNNAGTTTYYDDVVKLSFCTVSGSQGTEAPRMMPRSSWPSPATWGPNATAQPRSNATAATHAPCDPGTIPTIVASTSPAAPSSKSLGPVVPGIAPVVVDALPQTKTERMVDPHVSLTYSCGAAPCSVDAIASWSSHATDIPLPTPAPAEPSKSATPASSSPVSGEPTGHADPVPSSRSPLPSRVIPTLPTGTDGLPVPTLPTLPAPPGRLPPVEGGIVYVALEANADPNVLGSGGVPTGAPPASVRVELKAPDGAADVTLAYYNGDAWVDLGAVGSGSVPGATPPQDLQVLDSGHAPGMAWAVVNHTSAYALVKRPAAPHETSPWIIYASAFGVWLLLSGTAIVVTIVVARSRKTR